MPYASYTIGVATLIRNEVVEEWSAVAGSGPFRLFRPPIFLSDVVAKMIHNVQSLSLSKDVVIGVD